MKQGTLSVVHRNISNLQTYRISKSAPQNNKVSLRSGEKQCSDLKTKKKRKDRKIEKVAEVHMGNERLYRII